MQEDYETKEHLFTDCTIATLAWNNTMIWSKANGYKTTQQLSYFKKLNCFHLKQQIE
jgi:hypothetical protein